jgi:hypothetical protein
MPWRTLTLARLALADRVSNILLFPAAAVPHRFTVGSLAVTSSLAPRLGGLMAESTAPRL